MGKFLLFGATRGLGLVTAELFYSQGHEVIILGRQAPEFINGFQFYQLDMSDKLQLSKSFTDVLTEVGTFTGACFFQRLRPASEIIEDELQVSVIATQVLVDAAVKNLDDSGDHPFIFTSSVNSKFISQNASLGYHLSKASLDIMAKYFAVKYGHLKARFNTVNPGGFMKPETMDYYENKFAKLEQMNPINRTLTAKNIADTILFLCSQNGMSFNGVNLLLDNGASTIWPESIG